MRRAVLGVLACAGLACGPTPSTTTAQTSFVSDPGTTSQLPSTGTTTSTDTGDTTAATTAMTSESTTEAPLDCGEDIDPAASCDTAIELLLEDDCDHLAGYEACPDGSVHRHTAVDCRLAAEIEACAPQQNGICSQDTDCSDFPPGACHNQFGYCLCRYPCQTDDDCGPMGACACDTQYEPSLFESFQGGLYTFTNCVSATCRSDEDCPGMYTCGLSPDYCGGVEGFFCHGPADECQSNSECDINGEPGRCSYDEDEARWLCEEFVICE